MNRPFLCSALLCLLSGCMPKKDIRKVTFTHPTFYHDSHEQSSPPITVWVHGTRFIRRPIFHTFFKSKASLRLAKEMDSRYYLHKISVALSKAAPNLFPLDSFYLFGWSGKLSTTIRQNAAKVLYSELAKLSAAYKKKYGKDPIIRLITHSHGGTVALNMAKLKKPPHPFHIEELVLMACPVQTSTKRYVEDNLFRHTTALYSSLDMVQVLAPQITYNFFRTRKGNIRSRMHWPPFSRRCFEAHPKLAQVKLKMNGRALFHTEFTSQHFVKVLAHILHVVNIWHETFEDICSEKLLCVYQT